MEYYVYKWVRGRRPELFAAMFKSKAGAAFAAKHMQDYDSRHGRESWYTVETLDEDDLLHALIDGTVTEPWTGANHERRGT